MPNSYVININVKGDSGKKARAPVSATSQGEPHESRDSSASFFASAKKILHLAPVGYAIKTAESIVVAEMNRVGLRTGNHLLQEKINFTYNLGKKAALTGIATVGALATGNIPLALFTASTSLISTALSFAQESRTLSLQKSVEDVGRAEADIRAGAKGGRTE